MSDFYALALAAGFAVRFVAASAAVRAAHGGQVMNGVELVALVLSLGAFVYLTAALLKPEWFA